MTINEVIVIISLYDAGHMGQRPRSLLSSMATAGLVQQVCQVQWMVPIDDGSMVCESVQNWNATRLCAGLQQQHQVCRQGTQHRTGTQGIHH